MTVTELALLITALTTACGMFGRGVVWLVQWQSKRTIRAMRAENTQLRAAHLRKVRRRRTRPPIKRRSR